MRASVVRSVVVLCGLALSAVARAAPAEREVATTDLGGKPPVTLAVMRQRLADGGLKLRLVITPKGGKASSVTLYEGGVDEDGPTDRSFRSATVVPFPLPAGKRGARVDFEFQVPGSRKFRQVDSYVVTLEEPKLSLEITTRRERKRSKVCQEVEETNLVLEKDGKLFARPVSALESELDDDDLPLDKTCHGKQAGPQVTYKFDGDTFVQIDPPPPPRKKPGADQAETDD